MIPWNRVFDHFKDRSRGALFFGWFTVVLGGILLWVWIEQSVGEHEAQAALVCLGALLVAILLVQAGLWIRRERKRRRDRYKISPLSRDEISKARSKLVKKQSF